jgi:hypothetical protein
MQRYIKNLEKVFFVTNKDETKNGIVFIDNVKPLNMKKQKYLKKYKQVTGLTAETYNLHSITPDEGHNVQPVHVLITDDTLKIPVIEEVGKGKFKYLGRKIKAIRTN